MSYGPPPVARVYSPATHRLTLQRWMERLRRKQGSAARGQGVLPSHSSVDPSGGEEASPATHWLSCDLPRTLSPRRYACCSPTAQAKPAISSASNTQMPPSPLSPPSPSSPPWSSNLKARLGWPRKMLRRCRGSPRATRRRWRGAALVVLAREVPDGVLQGVDVCDRCRRLRRHLRRGRPP